MLSTFSITSVYVIFLVFRYDYNWQLNEIATFIINGITVSVSIPNLFGGRVISR